MEVKIQSFDKKVIDFSQHLVEVGPRRGKYYEVIRITDIVFRFEPMLYELIELIHVYIDQKLTREIAERQAFAGRGRMKAPDDFSKKADYVFVGNMRPQNLKQNFLSDVLKFLLRVAWEIHALDNKKYALISKDMDELGRMIGGWKRGLEAKTPA